MDKITLDFTLEEIRQLQEVCLSSWYHEPPGSEILLDAYKGYNKFLEILENYNMDKIALEFSLEEIGQLRKVCLSSLCYEPGNSDIVHYAALFYNKFLDMTIGKILSKH